MGDIVGEEIVCGRLNERGCVWEIEMVRGDCLWEA